uniref:Uncharacterized protein n=1 Tax=Oryza brachyantha TaxID=4533 RepID=J3N4D3_ORYBR
MPADDGLESSEVPARNDSKSLTSGPTLADGVKSPWQLSSRAVRKRVGIGVHRMSKIFLVGPVHIQNAFTR